MSIKMMTEAFKTFLSPTRKFVLIALCDNADDDGDCYPSVKTICNKTCLCERTVQNALNYLEEQKFIKRIARPSHSNCYLINFPNEPPSKLTPQKMHPAADAPRSRCTPNPAADAGSTPQQMHPESSVEPKDKPKPNGSVYILAADNPIRQLIDAGTDLQVATDWVALRKSRNCATTTTAINAIKKQADAAGMDLNSILEICCERGWLSYDAARNAQAARGYESAKDTARRKTIAGLTGGTVNGNRAITVAERRDS